MLQKYDKSEILQNDFIFMTFSTLAPLLLSNSY